MTYSKIELRNAVGEEMPLDMICGMGAHFFDFEDAVDDATDVADLLQRLQAINTYGDFFLERADARKARFRVSCSDCCTPRYFFVRF